MVRCAWKSGFTLLEVIFATGVFALGSALLVSVTVGTVGFSHEEQMQNAVERETTLFLQYLQRDVLQAAAVSSVFPVKTPGATKLVLKVPEFDEFGVHRWKEFDYVLYAYYKDAGQAVRTVYDDELGTIQLASMEIPAVECLLRYFADGRNLATVSEFEAIKNVQMSAQREDTEREFEYTRRFVAASTLRNPNK